MIISVSTPVKFNQLHAFGRSGGLQFETPALEEVWDIWPWSRCNENVFESSQWSYFFPNSRKPKNSVIFFWILLNYKWVQVNSQRTPQSQDTSGTHRKCDAIFFQLSFLLCNIFKYKISWSLYIYKLRDIFHFKYNYNYDTRKRMAN